MDRAIIGLGLILATIYAVSAQKSSPTTLSPPPSPGKDWRAYGGTPDGRRYSSLNQINRQNVQGLEVAWTWDSGESGGLQTQPVVVGRVLYANTPSDKTIALDAASGRLLWIFDPEIESRGPNRGVSYWRNGSDERIFAAAGQYLYALDARTGKPISDFAETGRIDLRKGLDRDPQKQSVRLTSPGVIYGDLLIIGGRVGESTGASPGDVRAFDVRSGAVRWTFHTIPRPGEFGADTWPEAAWASVGGANNWAGMALDESRGIVYVPTGSAAADFYGADRIGDNVFANCLVALNARTGQRLWHFQAVHHDLWDRDFPSPPTLVRVTRGGRTIDAVAQTTKHGFVFVLDRTSGTSLFPIEERKFPPSNVDGEVAAATQPVPVKPAPFARQILTADMLTNRTPEAHKAAAATFAAFRSEGAFVPLSVGRDTVVFPGFDGGAEWGGSAFDLESGLLYVNANEMAWTGSLATTDTTAGSRGAYLQKYRFTGYKKFLDPDGYPAIAPPWGTLNAIDLNTGEYAWKIPLGEYPALVARGLKDTGSENYGGPIVTAGGLVFIGATSYDRKFRAFDKQTGALLWETTLPFSGNGTPATYDVDGRQYVVIAAGGGKAAGAPSGGVYVAFALPRANPVMEEQ